MVLIKQVPHYTEAVLILSLIVIMSDFRPPLAHNVLQKALSLSYNTKI